MPIIKRLNVNKFTSEKDNDAFIAELNQMWLDWDDRYISSQLSVDICKDINDPTRMTAFVTIDGADALDTLNEWSKKTVLPVRSKYDHENIMIDADLIASISK